MKSLNNYLRHASYSLVFALFAFCAIAACAVMVLLRSIVNKQMHSMPWSEFNIDIILRALIAVSSHLYLP